MPSAAPKKFRVFSFDRFDIQKKKNRIVFHYSVDNTIFFNPVLELDLAKVKDERDIHAAVFALGMAEIPSFYKTVCTPRIHIQAGPLTPAQIKFWETLYQKGLGEFFYQNKMDFRGLISITAHKNKVSAPFPLTGTKTAQLKNKTHQYLVPVGGGKDSVVTAESLKALGHDFTWFMLEPWEACLKVIKVSGNTKSVTIRRRPKQYFSKVMELNQKGFYNGHVPITAVYTFSAVLAAKIHGFSRVVFSNERSANTGNVRFHGQEVNHQYSKSYEFEKACHDYIQKYVAPEINCFSLLRNQYEIQIAQKFAQYPQYFQPFLSCNKGLKNNNNWCGQCAKCAFVYTILGPFLPPSTLQKIFGKNLLNTPKLIPIFEELLGKKRIKPFDCVGIPGEVFLALYLTQQKYYHDVPLKKRPLVLQKFNVHEGKKQLSLLKATTSQHLIPKDLQKGFAKIGANTTVAAKPKVAIVGFGIEGHALYDYLKKDHEVQIFDNAKTFTIPSGFSVIYRSPGIPLKSIKIARSSSQKSNAAGSPHLSSLTNLFFEKAQGTIIGVTGTKGKSTTASLLYHILKKAGLPVHLIGNIGKTGLELLAKDSPQNIYVYELSSYQLELLKQSPHIAVVTNLYEDHVANHGSLKAYQKAKANISRYQNSKDILIINQEVPASAFKTEGQRITVPPVKKTQKSPFSLQLLGAHNQTNALLAYHVAKTLKVPEKTIRAAMASFKPLPGRLEKIATKRGITFYEDALATIPQATWSAIETLKNVDTIILGGQDRGINFEPFAKKLATTKIRNFILFPDTGEKMVKYVRRQASARTRQASAKTHQPSARTRNIYPAATMEQAIQLAYRHTKGICLLSTASPSFNMFKDYRDRSQKYRFWIKKLG